MARTDLTETPTQLVSRYISGLRLPLQDVLNMFDPFTVSEAYQRVIQTEKQLARRALPLPRAILVPSPPPSRTPVGAPVPTNQIGTGPSVSQQRQSGKSSSRHLASSFCCFNCGEPGHRQSEYRQPLNRALPAFDHDLLGDTTDLDDTFDETVYVEGDVGPLLMLCRTFLSPRTQPDD